MLENTMAKQKKAGVSDTTDSPSINFRSINGSLDLRFNQSIDWFLNSDYYTAKEPINFLYVNEANQIENNTSPWLENRHFSFSKGTYTPGDKVILYYANEIYFNFAAGARDVLDKEYNFICGIFNHYNIPCQDVLLLGNIYENDNNFSKLAHLLGCSLLLIDYYELQTFFFHKVLGCDYNKQYNNCATKDIKYLFGKVDKPIRIIMMYELWQQGLLNNAITGCLVDKQDIHKLAINTANEYHNWYKKTVSVESISQMLHEHHGSPDNVPYFYFTLSEKRKSKINTVVDVVNHCPSYPYDHKLLFTDVKMSLVPETFYYQNQSVFLTEKIYKVIYNHHPFVILGNAGILAALKNKGYKTFDSICNEIYDECRNDRKRLGLVLSATKQMFQSTNTNELASITEHNFAQLEKNALITVDRLNTAIHTLINA